MKSGERRTATILFSDMKGFTTLSEGMDPEEIDALMTRLFGAFEEIIKAHGGIVEKYIGDALVAVFGVPEIHEDDACRAVHSALEFLQKARELSTTLAPGRTLSFRTGIHAGLVATGRRGEFDVVTGHAMNVAQRLEAAAEPDSILVSDAVRDECASFFLFSEPFELALKGKQESVTAYRVEGAAIGELREAGPFIGRREQLDEMLRAYLRCEPAGGTGVCLVGEAGIGKTALAHAFAKKVRRFPDFASPVLVARAQEYRSGRYAVIVDLLLDRFGLSAESTPEAIRAAFDTVPGLPADAAAKFARLSAAKEGAPHDEDAVFMLYGIFSSVIEQCGASVFPSVVVVDNANAIDRSSRDFFLYFQRTSAAKPFFLLAAREHGPSLKEAFPQCKPLRLGPMPEADARKLTLAVWPDAPDEAVELVVASGMGNPLFVREYAEYAKKHRDASSLPPTVQNIFLARIERYEPAVRDFMRKLSVFANTFSADDARAVQSGTDADAGIVEPSLAALLAEGVLAKQGDRYRFALDVFKKALYASILNHNKKILHGLIADLNASREKPNLSRWVYHLARAERWEEASRIVLSDPYRNYNYELLRHLDPIYRKLSKGDPDAALRILITKSALLFNSGKIDDAEGELKRIMRIAFARKNDSSLGFAYHQICAHNAMSYNFQKALFTGQKALYYYGRADAKPLTVQNVLRHLSLVELQRNRFDEARRLLERMDEAPERDPFESAVALAEYRLLSGDYRGAVAAVDAILGDDGLSGHPARFFAVDMKLKALWQLCDFAGVADAASALIAQGTLSEGLRVQAYAMLGGALSVAGKEDAANEAFTKAEFYLEQVRNDFDRVDALRTLAQSYLYAGDERKAERAASEGLVLGLRHSCYYPAFTIVMILVALRHGRGELEEARFFLREASYFFTTGLLLPAKATILYYHYAAKLSDGADADAARDIASRLLDEELAKLGDDAFADAFLAARPFRDFSRPRPDGRRADGGRAEGGGADGGRAEGGGAVGTKEPGDA